MLYSIMYKIIEISLICSVTALFIIAVRRIFRSVLPKNVLFLLWLVLIFRLLIPFDVPSPVNLYRNIDLYREQNELVNTAIDNEPVVTSGLPYTPGNIIKQDEALPSSLPDTVQKTSESVSLKTIISISYICITATMLSFVVFMYIYTYRKVKASVLIKDARLERIQSELGYGCKIKYRILTRNNSTLLFGIFTPTVILPENYATFNDGELGYLIAHELKHFNHFDNLWNLIILTALSIHWFNPIIWIARKLLLIDIEEACDERVIVNFSSDKKKDYANTIINLADRKISKNRLLTVGFDQRKMKERIVSILNYKKTGATAIMLATILVLFTVTVFASGGVNKQQAPVIEDTRIEDTPYEITEDDIPDTLSEETSNDTTSSAPPTDPVAQNMAKVAPQNDLPVATKAADNESMGLADEDPFIIPARVATPKNSNANPATTAGQTKPAKETDKVTSAENTSAEPGTSSGPAETIKPSQTENESSQEESETKPDPAEIDLLSKYNISLEICAAINKPRIDVSRGLPDDPLIHNIFGLKLTTSNSGFPEMDIDVKLTNQDNDTTNSIPLTFSEVVMNDGKCCQTIRNIDSDLLAFNAGDHLFVEITITIDCQTEIYQIQTTVARGY